MKDMKEMKKSSRLFVAVALLIVFSAVFVWMMPVSSFHSFLEKIPLKKSSVSHVLSKQDLVSAAALSASTSVNVFYNRYTKAEGGNS